MMKRQALRQSSGATGKGWLGGILQSTEKTGAPSSFAHLRVNICMDRLDKEMNPPPWMWTMAESIQLTSFLEEKQQYLDCYLQGYLIRGVFDRTRITIAFSLGSKISRAGPIYPSAGRQIFILDATDSNLILERCLLAPFSAMFQIICACSKVGALQNIKLFILEESFIRRYLAKERTNLSFCRTAFSCQDSFSVDETAL